MKKIIQLTAILCTSLVLSYAQSNLKQPISYYLPDIKYNPHITPPEQYLGFQVGEWHVSHDLTVAYMKHLDSQSDRIEIVEYARSHENRPLITLYISSPENIKNKEIIRKKHVDLANIEKAQSVSLEGLPLILYQGYSIHGNESSGINASLLVAYYLAAGESIEVLNTLNNCFIILDPCYNPDGVTRFSTWANSHKGKVLISDPNSREFNEVWPGGRTNHYWFDLNRDWLLLTHPESRGRVKHFQSWKPNVLTDHHEMGTNSTFFFQPGVPSRTNPNTPWENQELTEQIGNFHAAALDSIGSMYYSKQNFDDYYYGKGSTYPDIQGAVGILFEQASSRGHLQESDNGLLSFPFTIRNQVVTSLSTQRACVNMKNEMLNYKKAFFTDIKQEINNSKIQGYIIYDEDKVKLDMMVDILSHHDIKVYAVAKPGKINNTAIPENAYVIPSNQSQYKLIKTIFEKVRTFKDSLFYDVSAWTVPLAFDVMYEELDKEQLSKLSLSPQPKTGNESMTNDCQEGSKTYAYAFNWNQAFAPAMVNALLEKEIIVKMTLSDIKANEKGKTVALKRGGIIVGASNQQISKEALDDLICDLSKKHQLNYFALSSGSGEEGIALGHPDVVTLELPKIFTIIGQGISAYDAGELWHYMDFRLSKSMTMIDKKDLSRTDFNRYNTLVLVEGNYNDVNENVIKRLEEWVRKGGKIIAMNNSIEFLRNKKFVNLQLAEHKNDQKQGIKEYHLSDEIEGAKVVGGSIFGSEADLSHPLCFGLSDNSLALFKQGSLLYQPTINEYATPLRYSSKNTILSGYSPKGFSERCAGTAALTTHSLGGGRIFCYADNVLFRGYWWGGFRVFANALFFGNICEQRTLEKEP